MKLDSISSQSKLTLAMNSPQSVRSADVLVDPARTRAVVFENPEQLALRWISLPDLQASDVAVEVEWSGISTGTEKLLWRGEMPSFPGMGYPLVPGYETVGRVVDCGSAAKALLGQRVFVSGARCFGDVHGLFGGAASRLVVDADKVLPLSSDSGEDATLFALAATAHHALLDSDGNYCLPDLLVGHGVLGRLIARLCVALGGSGVTVWETNAARRGGAENYSVLDPADDQRQDYSRIVDVSGDSKILNSLLGRIAHHGEIVLAGFYPDELSFAFPVAFMREARLRVAAEWQRKDLESVSQLVANGSLSLAGLITHRASADDAPSAYPIAFSDPECLKMILDWRQNAE